VSYPEFTCIVGGIQGENVVLIPICLVNNKKYWYSAQYQNRTLSNDEESFKNRFSNSHHTTLPLGRENAGT